MLLNPYRFASAAPPVVTVHRYWRLRFVSTLAGSYCSVGELEMAATAGGANQCYGGGAFADSTGAGSTPAYAFDNNPATAWYSFSPPKFVGYLFSAAVAVSSVRITAENGSFAGPNASPKEFAIEYSDDGVVWKLAASFNDPSAWAAGEKRTFSW